MKNTLIGILIGIAVVVGVGMVRSNDSKDISDNVRKFQDGNTTCYVFEVVFSNGIGGISCVRTK